MKNLRALHGEVKRLQNEVSILRDIEQIKKLQRIYSYYLDYHMWEEIVGLFSDETESIEVSDSGVFFGKKGVKKFFKSLLGGSRLGSNRQLHITMQLQGIIDIEADGKTAKGRWQALECIVRTIDGVSRQLWGHGVYENDYIKENGKWRFKKLHFYLTFRTPFEHGWLKTPVVGSARNKTIEPDRPPTAYKPYPSGYMVPFHFEHPVTGKR